MRAGPAVARMVHPRFDIATRMAIVVKPAVSAGQVGQQHGGAPKPNEVYAMKRWSKPQIREISVGCEINSYYSGDF